MRVCAVSLLAMLLQALTKIYKGSPQAISVIEFADVAIEVPLLLGIFLDPVLLIGIGLGLIVTLLYVASRYNASVSLDLGDVVNFFLCTSGFVIGIKICILAIQTVAPFRSTNERLFIFIGGIAVIWVSVQNILRAFPSKVNKHEG